MDYETEKLKQLKIYFFFMYVDGKISPAETRCLNEILTKSDLSKKSLQEFQNFCSQKAYEMSIGNPKIIIPEIDKILRKKSSDPFVSKDKYSYRLSSEVMEAQTIWTLINLGYADSEYSESEKQITDHLIRLWKINPDLVAEFNDTADAIFACTLQKQWIQNTTRPYTEINNIVQELDRNITTMLVNVEMSISEVNVG